MNWWLRLRKRRDLDRDLEEEIRFHKEMRQADDAPPPFGNSTLIKETVRDMWSLGWIEILMQDGRYALRGMWRAKSFTLTAILLLALAIGANTAMFAVFKRVLLDPLPYPDADRLVRVWELQKQHGTPFSVTAFDYLDWAARAKRFDGLAAYTGRGMSLTGEGEPELFIGVNVSTNFFQVIGVRPALGRDFRPEEKELGRDHVLVLSHNLWQRKFGGSPSVIGRAVRISGEQYEIIGVMPPGFSFPEDRYEAWTPLAFVGGDKDWINRNSHFLRVFGRMRPSETVASVSAEMEVIAAQLEQQYSDTNRNIGSSVKPLKEFVVGDSRSLIVLLDGAVILLLLIACSNLASLLIARSTTRRQEFAMRTALGASRLRLIAQVIVETGMLSVAGGIAGILLARALVYALKISAPDTLPRLAEIEIDPQILAFSAGLSILTALFIGLAPASGVSRVVQSARGIASHGLRQRARSILVVGQIGLAVLLLSGAGLVIRSFYNLTRVDMGFRTENVVTMNFGLDPKAYPTSERLIEFARQLNERLSSSPGMIAAGFSTSLPLTGQGWGNPLAIEGKPTAPGGKTNIVRLQGVSPHYFEALSTPLRAGRHLSEKDDMRSPLVVLVDEAFERQSWRDGASPVGRRVKIGDDSSSAPWRTIVGVVAATRQFTIEGAPEPHVYLPYAQMDQNAAMVGRGIYMAGRSASSPTDAIGIMKSQLAALDRNLPVREVQQLRERVDTALSPKRFSATLMSGFAGMALLLAAVGLYGLIAFAVSRRTQEIGVRMALGASSGTIIQMILTDGLRLTVLGIGLGIGGALMLSNLLQGMVYGVSPRDSLTLSAVGLLLGLVAIVASYLPARRATRIDPMTALRTE